MRYAAIIEKAGKGYSAYVPDLPGCVAAGPSVARVRALLAEAVPFHLEGLRAASEPVLEPESLLEWAEV